MPGAFWAFLLLAFGLALAWYFLVAPRELQVLTNRNNRAEIYQDRGNLQAIPKVDEVEVPGDPHAESERSAERVARSGPPADR